MKLIRLFINELAEGFKQSKWLPLLTAYAVLSAKIGPGIHFPLIHVPFILLGLLVAFRSKFKMEVSALLLLLYLPINIIVTRPDEVFKPWSRLALFAIVFVFASPLLKSQLIAIYRKKILLGLLTICVLLGIGSFLCYFLGINPQEDRIAGIDTTKKIAIGDGCWLCVNSTILPGVSIGEKSVVAAGAVVARSFNENKILLAGVPAEKIKDL